MKTSKIQMLLTMALTLAGCGDLVEIPDVKPSDSQVPDVPSQEENFMGGGIFKFSSVIGDRTGVTGEKTASLWSGDETVAIYDGTIWKNVEIKSAGESATFEVELSKGTKEIYAVSPVPASPAFSDKTAVASLASAQVLGASPRLMAAKASGTQLFFTPLYSEVFFTVDVDGVKSATFKASAPVAGDCLLNFDGGISVSGASGDEITLAGDFEKGGTYSFTCLPASIESYTLSLSNGNDDIATLCGTQLNLKSGACVNLGTVIEDVPTYTVAHLWVYGGTGPEYGGGKVYDLLTKDDFFNSEDGRGIAAIKDNYFELRHDGIFRNWAGEDGRNWWMVYSGAHNPVNGKDIDVSEFYDIIPRSEARWSYTETGISFDMGDAGVVSAVLLPSGEHDFGRGVKAEITSPIALKFNISGGHDDWSNMYNEFNAITCRPRAMVVELTPMPVDFHAPEVSRTTDADFKYVAPPEPEDKFDFSTLPGKWNVRGGNSSPFGLWVLGGTGDDPAFISPIDKSWLWDDSIWRESDNELVIAVTSMDATQIKGTTNYWAGADGKFWNYTWKGTGEDLSRFFGLLPHGKYDFTFDLATFEITFGNSAKAKFLESGTHTFVHGKTLEIPAGCFGLNFELGTPEMDTPTADRWKDIDRFIYGIRNYVMIFEK